MSGLPAAAAGAAQFKAPSGHTLLVSPFTANMLATIEEEALRCYKRERMRTLRENAELFGDTTEQRAAYLRKEAERLADMMAEDLPSKEVSIPEVVEEEDGNGGTKQVIIHRQQKLGYIQWWLLTSLEGKTLACWLACRRHEPALTREAFEKHFESRLQGLNDLSNLVAELNVGKLGNAAGP